MSLPVAARATVSARMKPIISFLVVQNPVEPHTVTITAVNDSNRHFIDDDETLQRWIETQHRRVSQNYLNKPITGNSRDEFAAQLQDALNEPRKLAHRIISDEYEFKVGIVPYSKINNRYDR